MPSAEFSSEADLPPGRPASDSDAPGRDQVLDLPLQESERDGVEREESGDLARDLVSTVLGGMMRLPAQL